MIKSAASKRADNYKNGGGEWFCGFVYTPLNGLGPENGVHRRDPSSIIKVDDTYFVYYTKSTGEYFGNSVKDDYTKKFPWDYADIAFASSKDGINWKEEGIAVPRGKQGEYDERTVCTPDILAHDGKYYLVYQAQPQNEFYRNGAEFVAMAIAESPYGPFIKTNKKIVDRSPDGEWFGKEENNYNSKDFKGPTHDPMLMVYDNKFYLYFKGASGGHGQFCGKDTRWGVAISDNIDGPYEHSPYNPITNSGHETLLWHYKGGIACLINRDGPEKDTIQYAEDGVNFEVMAVVRDTPQAGGAFRCENTDRHPLEGLRWGLCHCDERNSYWNYMVRYDIDTRNNSSRFAHGYPKSNSGGLM